MIHWLTGLRVLDKNMDISEINQNVKQLIDYGFSLKVLIKNSLAKYEIIRDYWHQIWYN